jgi:hypothetical protein
MDLAKVLAELKNELANLDAAIDSLERLQTSIRERGTSRGDGDEGPPLDEAGPPKSATTRTREKHRQP